MFKIKLDDMKYKAKLTLLTSIFVVGLLSFALTAMLRENSTDKQIAEGKDIMADILPPPLFIVEAQLCAQRIVTEADAQKRNEMLAELTKKKQEFEDRHALWSKTLPETKLKETLLQKAAGPARTWFEVVEKSLVPLVKAGDLAKAAVVVKTQLEPHFNLHREEIIRTVRHDRCLQQRDSSCGSGIHAEPHALIARPVVSQLGDRHRIQLSPDDRYSQTFDKHVARA